jgi:hypothetical protein
MPVSGLIAGLLRRRADVKAEKAAKSAAKTASKAKKRVEAAVHDAVEDAGSAVEKAGKKIRETAEHAMHNAAALNARVIDHAEENAKEAFAALRKRLPLGRRSLLLFWAYGYNQHIYFQPGQRICALPHSAKLRRLTCGNKGGQSEGFRPRTAAAPLASAKFVIGSDLRGGQPSPMSRGLGLASQKS